MLDTLNNIVLV